MASVAPHPDEAEWDNLILGKGMLPGIWTVTGSAERRLDVKTRRDSDAAVIKDQGYNLAELTLTGNFATAEQWDAMVAAMKDIHPRRKGASKDPLAIIHPGATMIGVKNVIVQRVHVPTMYTGGGRARIIEQQIDVLEWVERPKKVRKKKPTPIAASSLDSGSTLGREFTHPISGQTKVDTGFGFPSISALESSPSADYRTF